MASTRTAAKARAKAKRPTPTAGEPGSSRYPQRMKRQVIRSPRPKSKAMRVLDFIDTAGLSLLAKPKPVKRAS